MARAGHVNTLLHREWWFALSPGPALLQLRSEAKQRAFVTVTTDELRANWQLVRVPMQWHGHRWLSGDIANQSEMGVLP